MLTVTLTALTPTTHRIAFVRADGSRDQADLDTRSFLVHDLLHFAVKSEAGFARAFFGRIAAGESCRAVADGKMAPMTPAADNQAWLAEMMVGPLTPVARGQPLPPGFIAGLSQMFTVHAVLPPAWLTDAFIARVLERFRNLNGRRKSTPFGQPMTLEFAPALV